MGLNADTLSLVPNFWRLKKSLIHQFAGKKQRSLPAALVIEKHYCNARPLHAARAMPRQRELSMNP
jgi:hypothetical protein